MRLSSLENYYLSIKRNRWHWIFQLICRILLAYAFLVAGMIKILGERFASGLPVIHPMGSYLEALHHTGYYYTFIGVAQVIAAILLLIPRTVLLGALLYLPIIINIWVLSYAVRFVGSYLTSPLMVLANLYILVCHYDKLKFILPFNRYSAEASVPKPEKYEFNFPYLFFGGVIFTMAFFVWFSLFGLEVMPQNSLGDCKSQFVGTDQEAAGFEFCECVHTVGNPLDDCLERFDQMKNQTLSN
ncbi:DoxX family protein [Algoriphagus halophytocola]|uniref:DoxX family protein n=1 Tax=Algoriphagus halophytocola TaxID=2991499 RepID=A0ABY6MG51_9BACT|nr:MULTISPECIES: DoxX family protein [unclassified Algoriphagus]UZD22782.1 DoxX family protein [Algoriphagus sp. TR-M5]WBL44048.1 DoxX family protein [Algoriphagus sp. TR-M9]